jgi:hypothetical protein
MSSSGSVARDKNIFKWPHPVLWLSPLWRGPGPLFEQTWIPFPNDNLYQVWLNLARWLWRRFFCCCNFQCMFTLLLLSPLGKRHSLSLEQTWIPFPKRMICAKSGKNWPGGSGEEVENVKLYRRTDDWQQAIRKAQLSFQLKWVKKHENRFPF